MGEVLVLTVLIHRRKVLVHAVVVVPLKRLHIRPALFLCLGDEVLSQWQPHRGASPEQHFFLALPRVCFVGGAAFFHVPCFALHLKVAAHFRLGPAPKAKVGE